MILQIRCIFSRHTIRCDRKCFHGRPRFSIVPDALKPYLFVFSFPLTIRCISILPVCIMLCLHHNITCRIHKGTFRYFRQIFTYRYLDPAAAGRRFYFKHSTSRRTCISIPVHCPTLPVYYKFQLFIIVLFPVQHALHRPHRKPFRFFCDLVCSLTFTQPIQGDPGAPARRV